MQYIIFFLGCILPCAANKVPVVHLKDHASVYEVLPPLPPTQNVIHLFDHEEQENENKLSFHFMLYADMVYAIPSFEPGETNVNNLETVNFTEEEKLEILNNDHDYLSVPLQLAYYPEDEIEIKVEAVSELVDDTEEAPPPSPPPPQSPKPPKPRRTYTCNWCGETNDHFKMHKLHIRNCCQTSVLCTECGKSYKNIIMLRAHEKRIHKGIKEPALFKCNICSKMFKSNFLLKMHLNRHMNIRNYSCAICNQQFFTKASAQLHMTKHTDEKPYQCPFCPMKYKYPTSLTKHLPKHDTNLTLLKHPKFIIDKLTNRYNKCDQCGKVFLLRVNLNYHLFNHHQLLAENFTPSQQCHLCHKAFKMQCHLRKHMHSHSDEKTFKCDYCPNAFRGPDHLAKHMIRHKEKTERCQYCSKAFRTAKGLDAHIRNHTNTHLPYRCMHCARAFPASGPLKRHLRRAHKDYDTVIHDNILIESNIEITDY